jgi:hypothetical protein
MRILVGKTPVAVEENNLFFFLGVAKQRLASTVIRKFHEGAPVKGKSNKGILFSIMVVVRLPIIKDPWIKGSG